MSESRWEISKEFLEILEAGTQVDKDRNLRACGCGVKIDLDQIVYPVLDQIHKKYHSIFNEAVNERRDSFVYPGTLKSLTRVKEKTLDDFVKNIDLAIAKKAPHAILELFSSKYNLYREFDQLYNDFESRQIKKHLELEKIFHHHQIETKSIHFAKGHSIQGEVDFILNDLLTFETKEDVFSLSNNDTIITGDSILEPHSPVSVFISINNALNDLFIHGAFHNIKIFPVYDGTPDQIAKFKSAFILYHEYYKKNGINIEILDQGPLGMDAHLIGATVVAESHNRPPSFNSVKSGQKIMLTHKLGDLAILSITRMLFKSGQKNDAYEKERLKILQKLMRSHYDMSQVIAKYLPSPNEDYDTKKHISFVSDVSGPGLSVLEEAAEKSGVSVHIETIDLITNDILNYSRQNYTSSTNGPWLIIGEKDVLNRLALDFRSLGLDEVHIIGETLKNDESSTIYIKKELIDKNSKINFKHNLFYPEISVNTLNGEKLIKCSLFKKLVHR